MKIYVTAVLLALAAPAAATATDPACPRAAANGDAAAYADATLIGGDASAFAAVADCLGDPDPDVRDGFALTALTRALRSGKIPPPVVRDLGARLTARLADTAPDAAGFRKPFAAIALAEVARVDRLTPIYDAAARRALVGTATTYLSAVRDYRGFVDGEGWRHGVAHGADLLMQLSLNPALDPAEAAPMLAAIAAQVAPAGTHAYVHGEPDRLARPLVFLAQRGVASDAELAAFFDALKPDASARWRDAYASEAGLAAVHNSRAFARAVLLESDGSPDPARARLAPLARGLLKNLP